MKILIVSAYFPPQNSIASLRPYSWAKYWSQAGHDVTVLTTKKIPQPFDLKLDCSSFKILEENLWIPFLHSYLSEKQNIITNNRLTFKQRILKRMKEKYIEFAQKTGCFNACRFPDWHDIWARKAIKLAKNQTWDLVVTTGWPYSTHHVGCYLKKNHRTEKWIVDWRDLWTKNHLFNGLKIFHFIERKLEYEFHRNADLITAVSEPAVDTLRSMTKTRVETIYNGFDPDDYKELLKRPRKENKIIEVVYTGSIYIGHQDPSPLFEAISELYKEGLVTKDDLHITFAGGQTDVFDLVKKYSIEDFYTFKGFLPREDALDLQYNADILLFLEYGNSEVKGVLTGKLFEYLYIGREIWAVGCTTDSDASALIENSNAGIAFGTDVGKIKNSIIERMQKRSPKTKRKNMKIIEQFNRKIQAERMLNYLEKEPVKNFV